MSQANNNQLAIRDFLNSKSVMAKFESLLNKNATSFITSILQIVGQNDMLKNADPGSIYQAASVAATLNLPLNNNLGFAYIVPFNDRKSGKVIAQFQLGYKGFIQLAQRSGQFKDMDAKPVYEGQIADDDSKFGGILIKWSAKKSNKIIGYAAYFELLNGFQKTLYMDMETLKAHGLKFSQTFKKGFGLWKDDFDSMALKTVLKLLLSKFAPLSVDMQTAQIADQSIIKDAETMDVEYVDNSEEETVSRETERIKMLIESATTIEQLDGLLDNVPEELTDMFLFKKEQISQSLPKALK